MPDKYLLETHRPKHGSQMIFGPFGDNGAISVRFVESAGHETAKPARQDETPAFQTVWEFPAPMSAFACFCLTATVAKTFGLKITDSSYDPSTAMLTLTFTNNKVGYELPEELVLHRASGRIVVRSSSLKLVTTGNIVPAANLPTATAILAALHNFTAQDTASDDKAVWRIPEARAAGAA